MNAKKIFAVHFYILSKFQNQHMIKSCMLRKGWGTDAVIGTDQGTKYLLMTDEIFALIWILSFGLYFLIYSFWIPLRTQQRRIEVWLRGQ